MLDATTEEEFNVAVEALPAVDAIACFGNKEEYVDIYLNSSLSSCTPNQMDALADGLRVYGVRMNMAQITK